MQGLLDTFLENTTKHEMQAQIKSYLDDNLVNVDVLVQREH
jgi:hypothetical protein